MPSPAARRLKYRNLRSAPSGFVPLVRAGGCRARRFSLRTPPPAEMKTHGAEIATPQIAISIKHESSNRRKSELQRTVDQFRKNGGRKTTGKRYTSRETLHFVISSIPWLLIQISAAVVDLVSLSMPQDGIALLTLLYIAGMVTLIFCVDLLLRIYTYRRVLFATRRATLVFSLDVVIVLLSVAFWFVDLATYMQGSADSSRFVNYVRTLVVIPRMLRAVRATLQVRAVCIKQAAMMRHITGENKTRLLDLENGFDLDLAYIWPPGDPLDRRIIAMSVPTTGYRSWFRNPISEVVRFLEMFHAHRGVGSYLIVNACPELPYPHSNFTSGTVRCFNVQDHTPPTMAQFAEFLNLCATRPISSTIAVHCRGGKGRTGSLVSAWLLYSRVCGTDGRPLPVEDVLILFALRRTEDRSHARKLQGVDTPSQKRYVGQLYQMLEEQSAFCPLPQPLATTTAATELTKTAVKEGEAAGNNRAAWARDEMRTWSEVGAVRVSAPARPVIALGNIELSRWFTPKFTAAIGKTGIRLVCAVHTERFDRSQSGAYYVSSWSKPVELPPSPRLEHECQQIFFEFDASMPPPKVSGDVRISIFDLGKLEKARAKRQSKGEPPRVPFDLADVGPWGAAGGVAANGRTPDAENGQGAGEGKDEDERGLVIAGKEPGCLFFWLFHTAFVESHFDHRGTRMLSAVEREMRVPVDMMDKAFKNKKGFYDAVQGTAILRWSPAADGSSITSESQRSV